MENITPIWIQRNYKQPGLAEIAGARENGPLSYGNLSDKVEEWGNRLFRLDSVSMTSFIAWGEKSHYNMWLKITSKEVQKISDKEGISSDTILWYMRYEASKIRLLFGEDHKHFQDPGLGTKGCKLTHSLISSIQRAVREIDSVKFILHKANAES